MTHTTSAAPVPSVLDSFRLDGRVAVVTGASAGLGVAFAVALAQAGADVVLGARRVGRLDETAELVRATGRSALAVGTDVSDPADCTRLVEQATARFGRLDILVNNAGTGTAVPALRESDEAFWDVLRVNIGGVRSMSTAAARSMTTGGSIVNVASIGAFVSFGTPQAAYSASKSAVIGLTRDLAQQWSGRRGIRVNAVAPGFVETELTEEWFGVGGFRETQHALVPLGRPGRAEEVAAAAVFLASDAASYITGSTLVVDGGRTIF